MAILQLPGVDHEGRQTCQSKPYCFEVDFRLLFIENERRKAIEELPINQFFKFLHFLQYYKVYSGILQSLHFF